MTPDEYYRRCGALLETHLEESYGIPVVTRDIPDPFTGDLDGSQIHIDYAVSAEERLFLILHLFGHTVQWNVSPKAREIGRPLPVPVDERLVPEIIAYEREAAGYALALLHHVGVFDLDQWMTDRTECDLGYLLHYYRTGERRPASEFFKADQPLIEPIAIPVFHPTRWIFRADGVVV